MCGIMSVASYSLSVLLFDVQTIPMHDVRTIDLKSARVETSRAASPPKT